MPEEKNIQKKYYGDKTPRAKDILIPIIVFLIIIVLSWVAYFKLGWLH
ncbi:MAG: hypothetical protein ABIN01_03265 [Ferruginibacter sp.]